MSAARLAVDEDDNDMLQLLLEARAQPARCGFADHILAPDLQQWFRTELPCMAGRREFAAGRYFAVDVRRRSDVLYGWRRFVEALEQQRAVACLYVIEQPAAVLGQAAPAVRGGVLPEVAAVAEVMSVLSDVPAASLVRGSALNFILHLTCPITGCRTAFFDFDAVAFVPQAADRRDPLYDPLMSAPVPMVNVNSDLYAFSLYTRDHCRQRFDCEVTGLTRRERAFLFRHAAESWQLMAMKTIRSFAARVDQDLCPTYLTEGGHAWMANHRDPAFAENTKCPYRHEMPVLYAPRIAAVWEQFFAKGTPPNYANIAAEGVAADTGPGSVDKLARCPVGMRA